jgi:hypothetical protein
MASIDDIDVNTCFGELLAASYAKDGSVQARQIGRLAAKY